MYLWFCSRMVKRFKPLPRPQQLLPQGEPAVFLGRSIQDGRGLYSPARAAECFLLQRFRCHNRVFFLEGTLSRVGSNGNQRKPLFLLRCPKKDPPPLAATYFRQDSERFLWPACTGKFEKGCWEHARVLQGSRRLCLARGVFVFHYPLLIMEGGNQPKQRAIANRLIPLLANPYRPFFACSVRRSAANCVHTLAQVESQHMGTPVGEFYQCGMMPAAGQDNSPSALAVSCLQPLASMQCSPLSAAVWCRPQRFRRSCPGSKRAGA